MKAIRVTQFGSEEELKVETNVPIPDLQADECLIRMSHAGVNPVDTYIRSGNFPQAGISPPYTPGYDGAGTIEKVGESVQRFKKGDRVTVCVSKSGTYAEFCVVREVYVGPLHESVSFAQGAAMGIPYYTAYAAIFSKAQTKSGETVLIHGASGAVGIAAVQMLKAHGCTVIGTAGTHQGIQLVKDQGADQVFNHREKGYMESVKEFTGGVGVDVIIEMLASANLQADMEIAAQGARIVIIGSRGNIEINPVLIVLKEIVVTGLVIMAVPEDQWKAMHAYMEAGQRLGWLKPSVSKVYPLQDACKAHHDVMNASGALGKLVLEIDGGK